MRYSQDSNDVVRCSINMSLSPAASLWNSAGGPVSIRVYLLPYWCRAGFDFDPRSTRRVSAMPQQLKRALIIGGSTIALIVVLVGLLVGISNVFDLMLY